MNRHTPRAARPARFEPRYNPRASAPAVLTSLELQPAPAGAKLDNLSEGGAFLVTDTPLAVGARILVGFRLDDADPVHVACEVRWLRSQADPVEGPAGVGVRFLDLHNDDALRIREAVEAHEPMFWE